MRLAGARAARRLSATLRRDRRDADVRRGLSDSDRTGCPAHQALCAYRAARPRLERPRVRSGYESDDRGPAAGRDRYGRVYALPAARHRMARVRVTDDDAQRWTEPKKRNDAIRRAVRFSERR